MFSHRLYLRRLYFLSIQVNYRTIHDSHDKMVYIENAEEINVENKMSKKQISIEKKLNQWKMMFG